MYIYICIFIFEIKHMKFGEFVRWISYLGIIRGKNEGGGILNSRCNLLLISCVYYVVVKRFFGSWISFNRDTTIPFTCLAFSPCDRADDIFLMAMIRVGLVPSFAPGLSSRGYLCICALFCGNRSSVDIGEQWSKKFVPGSDYKRETIGRRR